MGCNSALMANTAHAFLKSECSMVDLSAGQHQSCEANVFGARRLSERPAEEMYFANVKG
jgi:hypothetical protein